MSAAARVCAIGACLVLAGCTSTTPQPAISGSPDTASEPPGVVDTAGELLTETLLTRESVTYPANSWVAEGVLPPTNRWYSALAYADLPAKVHPSPVAITVDTGSLTIASTRIAASERLIAAQPETGVTVTIEGSQERPLVSVNDPVWTALEYTNAEGAALATATLAQGWPAFGLVASGPVTLALDSTVRWQSDTVGTAKVEGTTYVVVLSSGTTDGDSVSLDQGGWLQVAPVPRGQDAGEYAQRLTSPVIEVETDHAVNDSVTTSLTYRTLDGGTTALVAPAAVEPGPKSTCGDDLIDTIDGPAPVCFGNTLEWTVPSVEPTLTLDLANITDEERDAILAALHSESTAVPEYPADTYFGAKALYRDAQLLALASTLGDTESFDRVAARLAPALSTWTEADGCDNRSERCFVYDAQWSGVVGHAPSFGSDEFNDHHFHYGYLIYAAAIAVSEGIVDGDQLAPVIDSLVADIASPGTKHVPTTRAFDPYAGHSWASGTSPFTDGNNQESSGEAVMAWTAVAGWSRLRGDDAAAVRAEWMLAAEAHSAVALYLRPDTDFAPEYAHSVVGIQWGAKRDWATWFSADPAAMLGIQLIPLAPSQVPVIAPGDDEAAARVSSSTVEAMPSGSAEQFTDLITMYGALAGGEARKEAWDAALALPDAAIDDGVSRAYMLAFIAAAP